MVQHFKVTIFGDCLPVYDGKRSLYTVKALPVASGGVSLLRPVLAAPPLGGAVLPNSGLVSLRLLRLIWT